MFVVTADQKDSRHDVDRAGEVRDELARTYARRLALPVDRTAGDEVQALVTDASTAFDMVLRLTRAGHWSVGLGIGEVRSPLPRATREATGPAFIAAREAVARAKRSPTRFALAAHPGPAFKETAHDAAENAPLPGSAEVEALITLLLLTRDRRTTEGWETIDLMSHGGSQRDAAKVLGITPQAVSTRLRTSGWRAEQAAIPGLEALLAHLDRGSGAAPPRSTDARRHGTAAGKDRS